MNSTINSRHGYFINHICDGSAILQKIISVMDVWISPLMIEVYNKMVCSYVQLGLTLSCMYNDRLKS